MYVCMLIILYGYCLQAEANLTGCRRVELLRYHDVIEKGADDSIVQPSIMNSLMSLTLTGSQRCSICVRLDLNNL
jgi:hypothetical protein